MDAYVLNLPVASDESCKAFSSCCSSFFGALVSIFSMATFERLLTLINISGIVFFFFLAYSIHVFVFKSIRRIMKTLFPEFLFTILDPNRISPSNPISVAHEWLLEKTGISLEAVIFASWVAFIQIIKYILPTYEPLAPVPMAIYYAGKIGITFGFESASEETQELEKHSWSYWWPFRNKVAVDEPAEPTEYSWWNPFSWWGSSESDPASEAPSNVTAPDSSLKDVPIDGETTVDPGYSWYDLRRFWYGSKVPVKPINETIIIDHSDDLYLEATRPEIQKIPLEDIIKPPEIPPEKFDSIPIEPDYQVPTKNLKNLPIVDEAAVPQSQSLLRQNETILPTRPPRDQAYVRTKSKSPEARKPFKNHDFEGSNSYLPYLSLFVVFYFL